MNANEFWFQYVVEISAGNPETMELMSGIAVENGSMTLCAIVIGTRIFFS